MSDRMPTLPRKRVEIFLEAPLVHRVLTALDELRVPGYSLMDVTGGRGNGAAWTESGQIGNANRMVLIISLVAPEQIDAILTRLSLIITGRVGITAISDVEVMAEETSTT